MFFLNFLWTYLNCFVHSTNQETSLMKNSVLCCRISVFYSELLVLSLRTLPKDEETASSFVCCFVVKNFSITWEFLYRAFFPPTLYRKILPRICFSQRGLFNYEICSISLKGNFGVWVFLKQQECGKIGEKREVCRFVNKLSIFFEKLVIFSLIKPVNL